MSRSIKKGPFVAPELYKRVEAMNAAFDEAKAFKGAPTLIGANTTKGCGSPVMENKASWHHHVPTQEEYDQIMKDLKEREEAALHE